MEEKDKTDKNQLVKIRVFKSTQQKRGKTAQNKVKDV